VVNPVRVSRSVREGTDGEGGRRKKKREKRKAESGRLKPEG
jgi:hypothetical protein